MRVEGRSNDLWRRMTAGDRLFVIAGPCVMEHYDTMRTVAEHLSRTCEVLGVPYLFKSSYDKANRTSLKAFRGPGLDKGLRWLERLKAETGIPILTDIHAPQEAAAAATVADVLQIPAFLCRQTDLLVAAARTGRIVNIKKGQFMAPWDMGEAIAKVTESGNPRVVVTERGTTFGYNNLVVDMRAIAILKRFGIPVVFDATHSVQTPGGLGRCSGGERHLAPVLARAAVAAGADGIFLETHPDPERALCDGPNSLRLSEVHALLEQLVAIFSVVRYARGSQ